MTTSTQTRPLTTDATATQVTALDVSTSEVTAPARTAAVRGGRLSSLRAAVRTRRAQRSELSRQIAAYPATRGAGVTVLPSDHPIAGPTNRF